MRAEASMDSKECDGKRKRKTKVDEHGLSQPAFWFNMTKFAGLRSQIA